jgi:hypothetical protein
MKKNSFRPLFVSSFFPLPSVSSTCRFCGSATHHGVCIACGAATVCSICQSVRQPSGAWLPVPHDREHASHSLCPTCTPKATAAARRDVAELLVELKEVA